MRGLEFDEDNNTTTRLLTLLNVSALRSSKRRRSDSVEPASRVKLNRRRSLQLDTAQSTPPTDNETPDVSPGDPIGVENTAPVEDTDDDQGSYFMPFSKLNLT